MDNLVTVLTCVLRGRRAVYVSGPITSGRRLFALKKAGFAAKNFEAQFHSAVVEPNIRDIQTLVARCREQDLFVIDPSRLPFLPGWKQIHYYQLWIEVIRRYASKSVFSDGWEYSSGCVYEFGETAKEKLPAFDARGRKLNYVAGVQSVREALRAVSAWGLDAPSLRAASIHLEQNTFEDPGLSDLALSTRDQVDVTNLFLGSLIEGRTATCVSSPILSGKRVIDRAQEVGRNHGSATTAYAGELVDAVVELNLKVHKQLVSAIEQSAGGIVLDLSVFSPVGWVRRDHEALTSLIFNRYVNQLVLGVDWYYSTECIRVYSTAIKSGVSVIDDQRSPLPIDLAVIMIKRGAAYSQGLALEETFRTTLQELSQFKDVA
jgi:hypothetical protein